MPSSHHKNHVDHPSSHSHQSTNHTPLNHHKLRVHHLHRTIKHHIRKIHHKTKHTIKISNLAIGIGVLFFLTATLTTLRPRLTNKADEGLLICSPKNGMESKMSTDTLVLTNNKNHSVRVWVQENYCSYTGVIPTEGYQCNNYFQRYEADIPAHQTRSFTIPYHACQVGQLDINTVNTNEGGCYTPNSVLWSGGLAFITQAFPTGCTGATEPSPTASPPSQPNPTNTPTPTPTIDPPKNLKGYCTSPDGPVYLSWTDSSNDVGYWVSRFVYNSWNLNYLGQYGQNSTAIMDFDTGYAKYGNIFRYNVKACADLACSRFAYSANEIVVSCPIPSNTPTPTPSPTATPTPTPTHTPTPTPTIDPPKDLTGRCAGPNGPIYLSWKDSSNEIGYWISRNVNNVWNYNYLGQYGQNSTAAIDTDTGYTKYNNFYVYKVKACGTPSCSQYLYGHSQIAIACPTPLVSPVPSSQLFRIPTTTSSLVVQVTSTPQEQAKGKGESESEYYYHNYSQTVKQPSLIPTRQTSSKTAQSDKLTPTTLMPTKQKPPATNVSLLPWALLGIPVVIVGAALFGM